MDLEFVLFCLLFGAALLFYLAGSPHVTDRDEVVHLILVLLDLDLDFDSPRDGLLDLLSLVSCCLSLSCCASTSFCSDLQRDLLA